ncbi:MAG: hydantoinase B/oxoprolinase family protein [Deltaproteobacteria bacterium]|nr:hydantoinase B/oxoprolinase family protein [Deltaproteobacteria bacterium]
MPTGQTDKVLLEILNNKFQSVTEEMAYTLQRTAHTVFVNETADFSTGLCTPGGELFAYPRSVGISVFINLDLGDGIRAFPAYDEGDIVITNDPYTSGGLASHLTDTNLFKPIFVRGELLAFAWAYVHSTDVGGKVPGSLSPSSNEVFQEGIRVTPFKLYRAGELDREFLGHLLSNCRAPNDNWGDIKAVIAALNTGEQRLKEMVEHYGLHTARQAMSDVLEYGRERAATLFREIPDGVYEFTDYLDDDVVTDIPVRIRLRMTVRDSAIHLDYTGSDPQSNSAFNIPSMGKPHPWVTYRLISYLYDADPKIPINAGLFRGVSATLPEGSIVNCRFPAAVGLRTTTSLRLMDVIQGALARALPGRVPAASAGAITPVVLAEPDFQSGGRRVSTIEPLVGGIGASPHGDGLDARDVGLSNLRNNPIEIVEADSSIVIREYGVRPDSGGPGRFRGGTGVVLEFEARKPNTVITARGMERQRFRAWGIQGGRSGANGFALLNPGTAAERNLRKIDVLVLNPGDVVRIATPGGGGYGDPYTRDPALVLRDVERGRVTVEGARRDYGVAIRDGRVDPAETERLRRARGGPDGSDFDFGPERAAHERVWTEAMYDRLMAVLYALPIEARPYVRSRLVAAIDLRAKTAHPGPADLDAEWAHLRAQLRFA